MLLPTEVITVQRIVLPWFFLEGTAKPTGSGDVSRPSLRKFMEILVREVDLGVVDPFITIVLEPSKLM